MSAALVAVVLAVVLGHALPAISKLRRFDWFDRWRGVLQRRLHADLATSLSATLLLLLPPVLLLAALQSLLDTVWFGLPGFLLALAVLVWCWGPRDLDRGVEAVLAADSNEAAAEAARRLAPDGRPVALEGPALVTAVFAAALQRWFAVLLWFLLMGPAGALFYRLAQLAADRDAGTIEETPLLVLRQVLEWPAAQLMTLALALAGSFDVVVGAWRDWYRTHHGVQRLDSGFVLAAARASVVCELAEEAADEVELGEPRIEPGAAAVLPLASALRDAMSLVWRVLIVWLTVLALFVLAGYVR